MAYQKGLNKSRNHHDSLSNSGSGRKRMLRRLERGAFFFWGLFLIAFAVHENSLWLRELNLPLCVFIGSFYSGFTVGYDNRGKNNPKCFIVAL